MSGHKKLKMSSETLPPCEPPLVPSSTSLSSSSPLALPKQEQLLLECPYNDDDQMDYCHTSGLNWTCVCRMFPTIITQTLPITTSVSSIDGEITKKMAKNTDEEELRSIANIPLRFIDHSCPSFINTNTDGKHSISSSLSLLFSSTPLLRYRCTTNCGEDDGHQRIETHPTVMIHRSMIDNMKANTNNGSHGSNNRDDDGNYQTTTTRYSKLQRLLPRDIIGMIFDYIGATTCFYEERDRKQALPRTGWVESDKPDLRDSAACEVVCRQWYLAAQQYGFGERTFDTQPWFPYDDCDNRGTQCQSQQQLHHVAVTFMYRVGAVHFQPSKINRIILHPGSFKVMDYSQFLAQFPSLTHVTIHHHFEGHSLDWNDYFPLSSPSLTLTSFKSICDSSFSFPLDISQRLPCLQSLILNDLDGLDKEEHEQLLVAINSLSNLTHLDVDPCCLEVTSLSLPLLHTLQFSSGDDDIDATKPWCSRQLQHLTLKGDINVSELKHIISVSSSIIYLSIRLSSEGNTSNSIATNKRSIEGSSDDHDDYEHLFATIATMTSLQSLSITPCDERIYDDHPSVLQLTTLTKLTSLTYPKYRIETDEWQQVALSLPLLTPDHINRPTVEDDE
jgi:hypothetical protein